MHNKVDNIDQEIRLQYKRNFISTGKIRPTPSKLITLSTLISGFLARFFIVNPDEQEVDQPQMAELLGSSDTSYYL